MYTFQRFVNPPFSEITYIVKNEERECIVIDPGGHHGEISDLIESDDLNLLGILLTHAHCDHVAGLMPIAKKFGAPIFVHPDEQSILEYSSVYWSFVAKGAPFHGPKWKDVEEFPSDELSLGRMRFQIRHTPGHTPGSCFVQCKNLVFTGDTLMKTSVGRTDLIGGDQKRLAETINNLPDYSDDTVFLPGHGTTFTNVELRTLNIEFNKIRNDKNIGD